jgi:hypothetical protein
MAGQGNKAIALKNARRVRLEGFTIWRGGHFAVLATGCDDLTIKRPADRHQPRRAGHRLLPRRDRSPTAGSTRPTTTPSC